MVEFTALPNKMAFLIASLLMAGNTPICPVQTEHICVLASSDSSFGQAQNNLVAVFKRI